MNNKSSLIWYHLVIFQTTFEKQNQHLDCGYFVNAAGPWAGELMKLVDIHLPVLPRKRYVFVFDCPKGPGRLMPLTIDPSGVYCKPEGNGTLYIAGCSPLEVFNLIEKLFT